MRFLKRFILVFCWCIAICIIVLAVGLNVMRFSLPYMDKPRQQLQSWVSTTLHVPVKIQKVEAYWRGLQPVLEFKNVRILDRRQKNVLGRVHYLQIKINLFNSLLHRKILPGQVIVNGCQLTLHQQQDGRLVFIKKTENDAASDTLSGHHLVVTDMLFWLLNQSNIIVRHVDVKLMLLHHKVLQLQNLRLDANHDQIDQLQGKVTLLQPKPSQLTFVYKPDKDVGLTEVTGKLYLHLVDFQPGAWLPLWGQVQPKVIGQYKVNSGLWSGKTWVALSHNHLTSVQVVGRLRHLTWLLPASGQKYQLDHVSGNGYWQRQQHGWQFSVAALDIRSNKLQLGKYTAAVRYQNSPAPHYALKIKQLDFSRLNQLRQSPLQKFLPARMKKELQAYQPSGLLKEFFLQWKPTKSVAAKPGSSSALRFFKNIEQASFVGKNLGWRGQGDIPGVVGLSGEGVYKPGEAHLTITSAYKTKIDAKRFFSKPLPIDSLHGQVNWSSQADQWSLDWNKVQLQSQGLLINSSGSVQKKDKNSAVMHSKADFKLQDVSRLQYFLPDVIMHEKLKDWLQHAFISGSINQGQFKWDGPLVRASSDRGVDHRWDVLLHMQSTRFHYANHWPDLMAMNGLLDFHSTAMHVEAKANFPSGMKAQTIVADIPDLRHAQLKIVGQLNGDLQQARSYLIKTPLSVRHVMQEMQMSGPLAMQLGLDIPLYDMKKKTDVNSTFTISSAQVALPKWEIKAAHAAGQFKIIKGRLFARDIKATMFGKPAVIQVATRLQKRSSRSKKNKDVLVIDINGMTTVADLMHGRSLFFSPYTQGYFPFKSRLLVYSSETNKRNLLTVDSSGQGLAIAMPPPFSKKPGQRLALHSTLLMNNKPKQPLILKITAGKKWSLALALAQGKQGLTADRGTLRLNAPSAAVPKMAGFVVSGSLFKLSWPVWKKYLLPVDGSDKSSSGRQSTAAVHAGSSALKHDASFVRLVDLQVGVLEYNKYLFRNISFKLWPKKDNYRLYVDNGKLIGGFTVPKNYPEGTVTLDLKKCDWPFEINNSYTDSGSNQSAPGGTTTAAGQSAAASPLSFPSVQGNIQNFSYKKHFFGRLDIDAKRNKSGLLIKKITTSSPYFNSDLSGYWQVKKGRQYSHISGSIRTSDTGVTAKQWDITDMLAGGRGIFNFDLKWPSPLLPPKLSKADGWMSLNVSDGRIINLGKDAQQKMGLGKLLNLLSLQTLPRRLALDFSDLTKKGYSYDVMKVKFNLARGRGTTKDGYLDGPVANVKVEGILDFAKSYYDLTLDVRPHLTSTLPIIATIAGTPIAGAVTWLLNKAVVGPLVGRMARKIIHMKGYLDRPNAPKVQVRRYSSDKNN